MVVTKNPDNRWVRRYRIFFLIGTLIFAFQIYLALRFFTLHNEPESNVKEWNPRKYSNLDINDVENSVNSARRIKDGFVIDDEDIINSVNQQKLKGHTVKTNTATSGKSITKNVTRLRIEELDFVPACEITTKEAISAIHRAKTQKCKQEISNITCLIKQGLLYPTHLPNHCPHEGFTASKSLGCFKDEKNFRLLNGYYGNYKSTNSPSFCIQLCLQSGYQYAGVQYSTECFCGNDEPPATARLPDSSCNMKCPADPHLACGGYYTINVYQTGIAKFSSQIAEVSPAPDTKSARIVFLLTLNGRALRQVKRLIKILYHRNHYFYIHVDIRQDYLFRELIGLEKQFPNIKITRRRFSTIWGGASLLQMLLSVMNELLKSDWEWDFVLNLSESDYPVKTLDKLVEFLSANLDKNFVKSHGREVQRFIQKQGLDKTFVECDTHMWRIGDRVIPWGIQVDGGSDWVALSKNFVSYVANDLQDELVKGLLILFRYTLLPAESFFHTVLKNSKFCNTYIDNNLHVTNWKRKLGCKCQYKHIVDWCGCSPNDFRPEDWLRIQNTETRQIFFARKFEPIVNQAVIYQLEQWLYGAQINKDIPNLNSYWQSVYNSLDLSPPPDDALLTIGHSVARISTKAISHSFCTINTSKILELTSFHVDDNYQKTLVLFEANVTGLGSIKLESSVSPKNTLVLTKSSTLAHRLQSLTVSSDYDPKEQILRNFVRIMGPYTEPTLVYQFTSSLDSSAKIINVTFIWIDPAGRLVDVNEASIEDGFIIGHVKPILHQPLLPGSWTIKMIHKHQALAEVKFLISPLEYFSGNIVIPTQVNFLHTGSEIIKEFDVEWDKFLPNNFDRESLLSKSVSNSRRFGPDLQEWIDSLINKFYSISESCVVGNVQEICGVKLSTCRDTMWSSFAPDPKSFIGVINKTSGSFDLW